MGKTRNGKKSDADGANPKERSGSFGQKAGKKGKIQAGNPDKSAKKRLPGKNAGNAGRQPRQIGKKEASREKCGKYGPAKPGQIGKKEASREKCGKYGAGNPDKSAKRGFQEKMREIWGWRPGQIGKKEASREKCGKYGAGNPDKSTKKRLPGKNAGNAGRKSRQIDKKEASRKKCGKYGAGDPDKSAKKRLPGKNAGNTGLATPTNRQKRNFQGKIRANQKKIRLTEDRFPPGAACADLNEICGRRFILLNFFLK